MKRLSAIVLMVVVLLANTVTAYACDEKQSENHVTEIIFGDDALTYSSNENTKMLMDALYLCCEQSDSKGQDKLTFLKSQKVSKIPAVTSINIKNSELNECAHVKWENEYLANKSARSSRKRVLQNTVNKVFDFGTFNNIFGSEKGKCNSLAAVIYYSHILSDYLADDPDATEIYLSGKLVSSYCGQAYIEINGNRPSFTSKQKMSKESELSFSALDGMGRCGVAYAVLGTDTLGSSDTKTSIRYIIPTGWNQSKYEGMVDTVELYNRCHIIAHSLANYDQRDNIITGTRYLNEVGMKPLEEKVGKYIKETGNHVLYRVTPVFEGDNKVVSGVQMEAYSVEDSGKGISFNVYCYNVQPGIEIDYSSGKNEKADEIYEDANAIPFAVRNPSENNPDLIYEMNKHLETLFKDGNVINAGLFSTMMGEISAIAYEARSLGTIDEKPAQTYLKMKECEYKYYEILKLYIPMMLKNEDFYKSAFSK